jgi:VanZ family protein
MESNYLHMRQMNSSAEPRQVAGRKWWWLPISWAILLFIASSIPGTSYPEISFQYADKIVHMVIYGTLGGLLAMAARMTRPWGSLMIWLFAIGLATVYGGTDELHQWFVPNRSADLRDLLADTIGAAMGAAVALLLMRRRTSTHRV